jgi:hypothetical protein
MAILMSFACSRAQNCLRHISQRYSYGNSNFDTGGQFDLHSGYPVQISDRTLVTLIEINFFLSPVREFWDNYKSHHNHFFLCCLSTLLYHFHPMQPNLCSWYRIIKQSTIQPTNDTELLSVGVNKCYNKFVGLKWKDRFKNMTLISWVRFFINLKLYERRVWLVSSFLPHLVSHHSPRMEGPKPDSSVSVFVAETNAECTLSKLVLYVAARLRITYLTAFGF